MQPDGEWRKKFNEVETGLKRLCEQARSDGSRERLWDVGAMVVRIEMELTEDLRARDGLKAGRRMPRPFHGVLGFLEGFLRGAAGFFQWTAAGLRVRMGRPIGELLP